MPTYLVTGGAGFIGSHLAEELVRQGEKVRVLDNFVTGKRENITHFLSEIELIEGDITDPATVAQAVKGADFVLHQAALPSVPRSVKDPLKTNKVNLEGTLNLLWAAREHGVKRFVYASSSSVYGNIPVLPKREDLPAAPASPYAVAKYAGELYCRVFHLVYGLETVALRYFNVFGPRQDPTSQYAAVVPRFITALLEGRPPTIYGDGEQSRDFTYVANVVQANLLACTAPGAAGGVFNIACGSRITVNELLRTLAEITGNSTAPVHTEPRPGDVRHSLADITAAQEKLGYKPAISFLEGLEKTVAWYRTQLKKGGSKR